jgi:transposase
LHERRKEVRMLAVADSQQQGLFDASWCGNVVPRDSFYGLLAEHGERIVSDQDFADCYSEGRGRPSIPPSRLAKILLLAYRCGLSDRQAMEAVRFDLRWKVALGLPFDHEGFHPTSLVKFRARLLLHGKERVVFERSLGLARELGLLEESVEQVVDSTPMLGAAATQDTVTLVRSGVRKLLDAVARADAEAASALERNLAFEYARPRQKPDCEWRSKPAREALLTRVAQDAERALRAVAAAPELAQAAPVAEAVRLLRELIGQDFELDEDDVPRLRRGTAKDRILSVHDPQMRHGRKSERQRFDGYKIHAAATIGERPLVTAIEVSPACDYDGHVAPALVDSQPDEIRAGRLLGDSAYGDSETRERLEQRCVEVLAPVPEPPPPAGKPHKREFAIDLAAGTVTCPVGKVAPIPARAQASGERIVRFGTALCRGCSLQPRCAPQGFRTIRLARREDLLQAGREALRAPLRREHLRRTRPLIERLLSLLVHRYRARKSRYRGRRKAAFQAAWTAVLVNLHPIEAALNPAAS